MIVEIAALITIGAFVGVAILGHVLVFRAIFAQADRISGKGDKLPKPFSELAM